MPTSTFSDLDIFRSHFTGVAERMAHTLVRTAYTTFVKESSDYATGLATKEGEFFGYPRRMGVSGFLGLNLGKTIAQMMDAKDGDVYITNDAYSTDGLSTHLPDVHMIAPVFVGGELVCYAWAFINCSDVGGLVAASISPTAYDVQQEGLRLPPTKLISCGETDEAILRIITANTRTPEANWGDFKAMLAALETGRRGVAALVGRFGRATVDEAIYQVLDWTEAKARAVLRSIPDGEYAFEDYLDDDGDGLPIRLAVKVRVSEDSVVLDYTGTDPQVQAAFNLPAFGERHPLLAIGLINFIITEDPTIPVTGAIVRPIRAVAPHGSVVNPAFPAAIGVRYATVIRLYNVVLGALAQAIPERVPAAGVGQGCMVVLSAPDRATGMRQVGVLEPFKGGGGATAKTSGVSGTDPEGGDLKNTPVESLELHLPAIVERYELCPDSAGAGRNRGGWGTWFEFRVKEPETVITARGMERFRFRPWGLAGGRAARLRNSAWVRTADGQERDLGRIDVLRAQPGDVVRFISTGGGGYGDPLTREAEAVEADVRSGLLSAELARQDYGVVLTAEGRVDEAATGAARDIARLNRTDDVLIDVGPERRNYESVWPPAMSDYLAQALMGMPVSCRQYVKRHIHRSFQETGAETVTLAWIEDAIQDIAEQLGLDGGVTPLVADR